MTVQEIIKKQKEYLTTAQIRSLVQAAERYKQVNAANRATAQNSLHKGLSATRRNLQNMGLAGRRGKLISGQEKAAGIASQEAYSDYNRQLRPVESAMTQNAANRMARETAAQKNIDAYKQYEAEYAQYLEEKRKYEEEAARQRAAAQQAAEQAEKQRTQQQQERNNMLWDMMHPDSPLSRTPHLYTKDYQEAFYQNLEQQATEAYKANRRDIIDSRNADATFDRLHPGSVFSRMAKTDEQRGQLYEMSAKIERDIRQKTAQWDKDIAAKKEAEAMTVTNPRDSVAKHNRSEAIRKGTEAMKEKASMLSQLDRIAYAEKAPEQYRKLYLMSDDEFSVAFDAAQKRYDQMRNEANADQRLSYQTDTREAESRRQKRDAMNKQAVEWFAPYEKIRNDRIRTSQISELAAEQEIADTWKVKDKDYESTKAFVDENQVGKITVNGKDGDQSFTGREDNPSQNWKAIRSIGWEADDFAKRHDVKGSKYASLVLEWALINGRTASLFGPNQLFAVDKDAVGGTLDFIQALFGANRADTDEYYKWFRNECLMSFRHNYDDTGNNAQKEQMDAMLTLANLMTNEERARFSALLENVGGQAADEYFETLYKNVLPERFTSYVAEYNADYMDELPWVVKAAMSVESVVPSLTQGIPGIVNAYSTNQQDPNAALVSAMGYNQAQNIRNARQQGMGKWGGLAYGTAMSMWDSYFTAAISNGIGSVAGAALEGAGMAAEAAANVGSKIGSALGGSLLGASAYNSTYQEGLERGLTPEKARMTALGSGINEMLFEAISLDKVVGHFQKGGFLKVSRNAGVNWIVNTLVSAGVEGSEEVFTDIANRIWDNNVNGIFAEELQKIRDYVANGMTYAQAKRKVDKEFAEQLGMSFLGGALSGGVMGGGSTFLGMVQNRGNEKVGKGLRQNSRVMNELRNFDFKSEYAQDILTQDKLTNQDVADLFNIMQQELLGQYKSDIQKAVADGKITQEQADLLKQYEQNGVQIVKDGKVVDNADGITVEQMPSVQDAIANLDNAARIQFLNNEEMRSLVQTVGGETAAIIEQSETAERDAERTYQQTVREINNDTTLSPEQKQKRLEDAERTRKNARSEASKIADTALTNKKGIGAKLETDGNGTVKVGKGSGKVTYDFSTKDNPGHQTVDSMTATEQSALRIAKVVAASRGDVNVKVEAEFVGEHANENGYYDRNTNTIHINMSGDNSVLWTLSHELTHHLANTDTEAYAALRTAIETALKDSKLTTTELEDRGFEYDLDRVDTYIAREGNLWDALVAFEREEHGYGKDAEEEVVARCCESFLGFDQFVKDFARKQYKSAKAVNKFIAQMNIDMQRVSAEARQSAAQRNVWNDESPENQILRQLTEIDRIANLWRFAVNAEARKRQAAREETRASTKDSVKRSDAEYLDLARRYESGDKSVEAELRKAVDAAARAAGAASLSNGKVKQYYHGTGEDFTSFNIDKSARGIHGYGFYVSAIKDVADHYAPTKRGKVLPLYLMTDRLATREDHRITAEMIGDIVQKYDIPGDLFQAMTPSQMVENESDAAIIKRLEAYLDDETTAKPSDYLKTFREVFGYDGLRMPGENVVWSNDLLKSADLVTYDNDGNIIPLSERFNTENEDIRYSKADKVTLSSVDSPVVNRIADESFPIQPKTNRAEAKYEKTVAHDTKVRLADIQDSMFHPVMRSIKDAVPISERTLAKARSLKEIPYNISMYESTEKAIVELAKFIKENYSGKYDVQGNLLLPEETVQSNNIFSNASYLKDAEPTTECYRQTIYRAFLKVVTDQLGRPVTEREAIIVNQACIEIGLDAPCIYCYSLLDRKAKEGYKLQYLAERDAFLAKIDEEYHGDIEAFKRDRAKNFDRYNELYLSRVTDPAAYKDGVYDKSMARKGNAAKVDRVKLWLDVYESGYHDGTMITANDVRNIEAEEASLKEAKGNSLRTRELKDILYWSQSASQAKKIIPYSAYTNDGRRSILSWSQNTIDALNREYGLRWYSHADFHPAFIVDNMQQIMDASVKGLKGLMYVKPVEAAKIFAPTGMLINVSCFAQYKNGQYVADDRMGADWTEVQNLRKQYENVGAVMVVTTDDMWMWAMTQDWVDVIIPLHLVRSGSEFVDTFGLHNYSEEQADKLVGKAAKEKYEAFIADLAAQQEKTLSDKEVNALKKANKSIYPGEHENDYAKYMEACEKRGLTPRFDRMRQLIEEGGMSWGGKEITLQDYMKCVSETRMPYTKAQTLKPSFDFDAAKQTAATLPEKGFFNYFKQSSEWNGKTMTMQDWVNQAVADINAKKDPSKLGYGRDLAVDESGKYLEIGTRAEAKRRGVGGIHDTRSSKMDKVRLSTTDGTRTYTADGVTAKMYGNDVELDGGKVRQRVQMMEAIAEVYGTARVDAASEEEAEAFRRAGAEQVVEELEGHGAKYGTWEFKYEERKFTNDSRYDIKQKQKFAKSILKQVGKSSGFTQAQRVKYGAALGRLMDYLWEMQYGKMDGKVVFEFADRLFDSILNDYTALSEADEEFRSELLANMTKTKNAKGSTVYVLEVNDKQMREIKYAYENAMAYASKLSKALGARVTVKQTENAKTLEDIFTNSTDTRIKSDTNEGDMPGELLRLAQETESRKTNPYAAESEERQALKMGMFDAAMSAAGVEKSTAQQIREAVKETRKAERTKSKTEAKKAIDSARLAERMHEGAVRAKERRISENRERALKQHAADREAKLKQGFRETTQKANETRLKRDMRTIALKWNQRLVKLLANPTEASHVPIQLAREVAELTKTITEYLDSGTERGRINLDKVIKAYQRSFADEETIAKAKAEDPRFDPRGLLPLHYDLNGNVIKEDPLLDMMNELNEIVAAKSFKDLSAYEMKALLDIVRGVAHTVYDANRMIGTSERRAIWEVGDSMIHQFEDAPDVKLKWYLETSLDLRRLARIFSGSNDNAEFVKLVERLNDGTIEKERIAQVLQDIFAPVTEKYGDEIRKWYGKKAEWIDTGITQNGKKVEITKGMRVSLAMHVLNAGNMNHIANGGITIPNREMYNKGKMTDAYANGETVQFSAEQIEEIISHMTEAEKAYVEAAKEFFHKRTGYYVNKTSLQLLGYRKATVENYFPIHTDKNFTKTDFASLQMDGSIEGQGFLKERVNASNPVYLEDITSVVNRQIRGVALYAGLAIPMRNFNAVMNSTEYFEDENGAWRPRTTVRKAMTQKMGEYGAKVVKGFLEDASEMTHVDVSPMERFAGRLASNYVQAVLLGNLKVAMKQVASYPTAAAVIPWKYLGKALLKGGRNGRVISRADVDLINQYTPLYQMRREGNANEIASIMAKRGMEQKLPWLLGWITKMDVMTVGRLWSAAEYMVADQQNLPVGSDEYYKAVAKVFNDTIQQTQPNFTPLQRNAALRSKNPVVRSFVLFGTQRMQNGGILIEAAMELKQSKGKSKAEIKAAKMKLGRAVASQIVQNILLIVASLGVDALRGRMKGWQDDDKEITAASLAKGMGDMFLSNFIGSFLGGSETYSLISGLFKKAMGETAYDTEFTVPALDAVETLINFTQSDVPDAVKYLLGDHTDEEKQKKAINFSYQLAKAFGYATGIPLENALKDVFKGIIPAIEDIRDAVKTGELNPWLHQSGKLDKKTTNANYKEWTNNGFKGSEYFYWENVLTAYGKREEKIPILLEADLPNEKKAMLLRMMDKSGATSEGTVVYKSNGDVLIDFANPTEKQQALPMPTADTEETATPTTTPTATPKPTENPLTDARQEGVKEAVAKGVPEQTAFDAFLAYQNMGKNKSDDYSRNDDFRAWLFANVTSPEQRAILEYQVIGTAKKVEGSVTYRDSGVVFRDYTNESWFKLSEHNLSKDGTNKRYEAGKRLEKTGLSVDKTVAIYDALAEYTKKAEWTEYLKKQGLTDEQVNIFLWSRGWAKLG